LSALLVDNLVKERGQLTQTMADTAARLEELRKQKAAADMRAATFRGLVAKLVKPNAAITPPGLASGNE
jgi:hypothetical protein